MQGKQYKTPCHKKYLTKIPIYWKMVSYPLIKEGQLSHKYAIAIPVEPMNLLSKGSNKSLPKYRSTIWKMVSYPHANKLLQKCVIFNKAINVYPRGPVEQHFMFGSLIMTPLVRGQRSNKYAFWRANIAIKKENGLIPPCSILLTSSLTNNCFFLLHWLNFEDQNLEMSRNSNIIFWLKYQK